ncbi:putative calcium ion binding protein [Trichocladium antarcticum]|uniref:Calcium ion binding protein n=1 Tax=Trichocladium antarcticum TaxID=1450529 RepID=A0AAN6UHJ7_9PEZI|nr:putative calcium ion binding protein [Trichocladium antarcticum]
MRLSVLVVGGLAGFALGHGDHSGGSQKPALDTNANWMTKHMAEEHHATEFDAASFFALHDYDADGNWEADEIQRTYGLMDESNRGIGEERRDQIAREVLEMIDTNRDGRISRDEFVHFVEVAGKTLPDMGTGVGHHGDDEYEYEIHHWEKYHDENTKLEDLTHPEDIEHFKKHEEMEAEEKRIEQLTKQSIIEANIPAKFRRG